MTQTDQGDYSDNVIELDAMWKAAGERGSKDPTRVWKPTKEMKWVT
ncbi:MAG: hypothetical protein AAGA96_13105 [Verrucomicrobiota bacterium]